MVQFCGKDVVRRASVQVAMEIKFWVIFPKAVSPVSIMYLGCPPPMST